MGNVYNVPHQLTTPRETEMIKPDELDVLIGNYSSEDQRTIIGTLLTHLFGTAATISVKVEYKNLQPFQEQVMTNAITGQKQLM